MSVISDFKRNYKKRGVVYAIRKFIQYLIGMYEYDDQLQTLHYFNNLFHDYSMIPQTDDPNLRILQECDAIQLAIFDKICYKYNLKYWLDFGTLLGAVRHHGFIPWDDDMDVAMPRQDYRKIRDVVTKELGSIGFEIGNTKWFGFGYKHYKTGIWVDVFPLDEIDNGNTLYYSKECIFRHKHPKKDVFPLGSVEFEGFTLSSPYKTDAYLKTKYGNYMGLPRNGVLHHGDLSGRPSLSQWAKINGVDMKDIKKELF